MNFTFEGYKELVNKLKVNEYEFCGYDDYKEKIKCVIMRHDIDYRLDNAVELAKLENELNIKSTYFVLLSSDFYNPISASSYEQLHKIKNLGHDIGLHFDETAYNYDEHDISYYIHKEAKLLSDIIEKDVTSFSLHRPNEVTLEKDLVIDGLINSYGNELFHDFKYLSDSRKYWREPIFERIESKEFNRIHILTHPFWYHHEDTNINDDIKFFIEKASQDRVKVLDKNISKLNDIVDINKYF